MARRLDSEDLANRCRDLRRVGQSLRLIAENLGVSCSTVRHHTRGIVVKEPKSKRDYWRGEMPHDETPLPPMKGFLRATHHLSYPFRQVGYDARLTRTASVKKLAIELDMTKQRTYIQKSRTVRESEAAAAKLTKT